MPKTAIATEADIVKLVDMLAAAQMREKTLVEALTFYAKKRNWVASDNGDGDLTRRLLCSDEHGYLVAQRALKAIS